MEEEEWFCHRCRPYRANPHGAKPTLTPTGHLPGCLGQNVPNTLAPKCRFYIIAEDRLCGKNASKQSCIWEEDGKLYCWCPDHWTKHCIKHDYDPDISNCANLEADRRGLNMKERGEINQHTIQERLGLPPDYTKEYKNGSTKIHPSNHISDERHKDARLAKKAEEAVPVRREVEFTHQRDDLANQFVVLRARATRGDIGLYDEERSVDEEPSSGDRDFIADEESPSPESSSDEKSFSPRSSSYEKESSSSESSSDEIGIKDDDPMEESSDEVEIVTGRKDSNDEVEIIANEEQVDNLMEQVDDLMAQVDNFMKQVDNPMEDSSDRIQAINRGVKHPREETTDENKRPYKRLRLLTSSSDSQ